jgi:hypothetical protein
MNDKFFFATFFCLVLVLGIGTTYFHEMVHVITNDSVGIESETKFALYDGWLPAVGIQRIGLAKRDLNNYEVIHLQNEIINYNITPMLFGLMITMFLGFVYVGEKVQRKSNDFLESPHKNSEMGKK